MVFSGGLKNDACAIVVDCARGGTNDLLPAKSVQTFVRG